MKKIPPKDALFWFFTYSQLGIDATDCWDTASAHFDKLPAQDFLILDHSQAVEFLDQDYLGTSEEDKVFDAIVSYTAGKLGLTQLQISTLWSTCRFCFLSVDKLLQVLHNDAVPQLEPKCALGARVVLNGQGRNALEDLSRNAAWVCGIFF